MILCAGLLQAQRTPLAGTAQLHELLDRLNTVGTMLMLGAHPDDENTAVMAYFARGLHLRTVYFSATRGEGGQNRIGTEQGELMGVIRTHELLEARRIDGGEQEFATVVDFGYTKTPDEALSVWGEERLLRDMVRVIRSVRPDVIVSRFPPRPGSGGHGHHTAVGWMGPTAFDAAADPGRFPELGLPPWQVRSYYYNVPTFSRRMEQAAARQPGRVHVDLGGYDPVLGKSYAEMAGESRSMHRSQAMGASQRKGSVPAYFAHVKGDEPAGGLFDGIDTTWNRVEGAEEVGANLALARDRLDPRNPGAVLPHLLAAYEGLRPLSGPDVDYKMGELLQAIEIASGLWLDAAADRWNAVPGREIEIQARALSRSGAPWEWRGVRIEGAAEASSESATALEQNRVAEAALQVRIPEDACYSQPHWLRPEEDGGRCAGSTDTPGPAPQLTATFAFRAPGGIEIEFRKPVLYRWVDPSLGERSRPLAIVPPVTVAFVHDNRVFRDAAPRDVSVRLSSNVGKAVATVRLGPPAGWHVAPASLEVDFARSGQERTATFRITPPAQRSGGTLTASATVDGRKITRGMRTIEYGHIPATAVFPPAEMRVERVDVELLATEIGYVMGAGDRVPEALEQLGAKVTLLTEEDLAAGDLERFDAVVAGVRALNTRPDLLAARDRVLEYVEKGGTLVVQYNTAPFGRRRPPSGANPTLEPYPMTPSRLRVTDERAKIRFLDSEHLLLTTPNRITAADFDGWVQERGLYFMSAWDDSYDSVISCSDPGEEALDGGLLYARYGKGAYVFTGYSWFRQLPAGVPGAYRIFANLVSAGNAR